MYHEIKKLDGNFPDPCGQIDQGAIFACGNIGSGEIVDFFIITWINGKYWLISLNEGVRWNDKDFSGTIENALQKLNRHPTMRFYYCGKCAIGIVTNIE